MAHQIRSYNDSTFRNIVSLNNNIWGTKDKERNLAFKISKTAFLNIEDFQYVYFINGATEFINYIALNYSIQIKDNEYRYLNIFKNTSTNDGDIFYMSYPFAGNGKFIDIPRDKSVVLDCAYLFASNLMHENIIPKNVDYVIFSLSKSHNIPDERVAWVFSKIKIPCYHILQYDNNYGINKNVLSILQKIEKYPLNHLYLKYKEQLSDLYIRHNLEENSTNLFCMNKNNRIPYYILKNYDNKSFL